MSILIWIDMHSSSSMYCMHANHVCMQSDRWPCIEIALTIICVIYLVNEID